MKVIALTGDTTLILVYSLLLDRGAIQRKNYCIDLENNDCLDVLKTANNQIFGIGMQEDYGKENIQSKNHI